MKDYYEAKTLRSSIQSKRIVTGDSIECSFFENQQLGHIRDLFLQPKTPSRLPQWSLLFSPDGAMDTHFFVLLAQSPANAVSRSRYQGTRRCMGVAWTVTVFAETLPKAEKAITAALDEVSRIENVLSDYQPTSELCQLSGSAPTPFPKQVSPDLWEVLIQAVAWRDRSQGAFDPTVGVFTDLWRNARQTRHMPSVKQLAAAQNASGPETFRLEDAQKVSLLKPDMRLDLGGIGMGFAIDRALKIIQENDISVAMVDASGDIGAIGRPPDSDGWRIEIDALGRKTEKKKCEGLHPFVITLEDASVTTSGDAFQAIEIEGIRYSHIVDPRTGLGVVGSTGVTVIAPDATTADALATTTECAWSTGRLRVCRTDCRLFGTLCLV